MSSATVLKAEIGAEVPSPRATAPRLRALDGLRLVAAFAVVVYHFTARKSSAWDRPVSDVWPHFGGFSQYGYLGVNLFFLISGFVILMTAWGRSLDNYAISRITRLFPAYWASVALTTALLFLWPSGKDVSPWQAIANLTMFQSAYGIDHVDGVYWTLWTELRFYLLMGVFLLVGINRRRLIAVCALWPMLAALAANMDQALIANILVYDYAPYFAAGMGLYLIYKDGHTILSWGLVVLNWCLALTPAAKYSGGLMRLTGRAPSVEITLLVVTLSFVAVAVCGSRWATRIQWKWLSVAGALTYPLYLTHEYWGFWIISSTHQYVGDHLALIIALSGTGMISWLIHRWVERPLGPALRGWLTSASRVCCTAGRESTDENADSNTACAVQRAPSAVLGHVRSRVAPGLSAPDPVRVVSVSVVVTCRAGIPWCASRCAPRRVNACLPRPPRGRRAARRRRPRVHPARRPQGRGRRPA